MKWRVKSLNDLFFFQFSTNPWRPVWSILKSLLSTWSNPPSPWIVRTTATRTHAPLSATRSWRASRSRRTPSTRRLWWQHWDRAASGWERWLIGALELKASLRLLRVSPCRCKTSKSFDVKSVNFYFVTEYYWNTFIILNL